jgi:hypothetical protein
MVQAKKITDIIPPTMIQIIMQIFENPLTTSSEKEVKFLNDVYST